MILTHVMISLGNPTEAINSNLRQGSEVHDYENVICFKLK